MLKPGCRTDTLTVISRACLAALVAMLAIAGCGPRNDNAKIVGTWETEQPAPFMGQRYAHAIAAFGEDGKVSICVYDPYQPSPDYRGTYELKGDKLSLNVPGLDSPANQVRFDDLRLTIQSSIGEIVLAR
jgi:hypothetical protein